jgi:hypothetical protein
MRASLAGYGKAIWSASAVALHACRMHCGTEGMMGGNAHRSSRENTKTPARKKTTAAQRRTTPHHPRQYTASLREDIARQTVDLTIDHRLGTPPATPWRSQASRDNARREKAQIKNRAAHALSKLAMSRQ